MSTASLDEQTSAAEGAWLERWTRGPTETQGSGLQTGVFAPDLPLVDHTGRSHLLSEFWDGRTALLMFWRHFGCGCGAERGRRLRAEWSDYVDAGLQPAIVGQGDPARAAAYRSEHELPCPVLCDPGYAAYRAYGVGQWQPERILFDAPAEYWDHRPEVGATLQESRRALGRPLVDDPWRASAEFVIGTDGRVRLSYSYQYCEDFPDPRVLTTAARLA